MTIYITITNDNQTPSLPSSVVKEILDSFESFSRITKHKLTLRINTDIIQKEKEEEESIIK